MEAKNTSTRPKEVYNDSKVERDASELGFRKDKGKLGRRGRRGVEGGA